MWLDDDGEDDPIAGPVPDPSERHWRHPSEVGPRSGGTDPGPGFSSPGREPRDDSVLEPSILTAGDRRRRWRQIPVVGSCVAVAALGLVALFVIGPGSQDELVTAGVGSLQGRSPIGSPGSGPTARPATSPGRPADREVEPAAPPATPEPTAGQAHDEDRSEPAAETAEQLRSRAVTTVLTGTGASSTTLGADATAAEEGSEGGAEAKAEASVETVPPPAPSDSPAPGVFGRFDRRTRLGSFLAVDELILTSAGALGGANELALWLGDRWIDAGITIVDLQSDLAVLHPIVAGAEDIPRFEAAEGEVEAGLIATVDVTPLAGSTERFSTFAADWEELGARPKPAHKSIRVGTVIAVAITTTRTGHELHDTLRTTIPVSAGLVGGPLLDGEGRAIGLIIAAEGPTVSATPIGPTLAYARALLTTRVPSTAWAGFAAVDDGYELGVTIAPLPDEAGSRIAVEVGDRLLAVNNEPVRNLDHFYHLVRQAGPGGQLELSIVRQGETVTVLTTLPVAAVG